MRRSYTIGQKNKITQCTEQNGVQAAVAYFKVLARSIYQWMSMKNELSKCNRRARSRNKRGAKWADLEEELHAWIIDQRQTGAQVDTCLIQNRAKTISVNKGIVNFGGTKCWCHSFMRRKNLSVRARTSIGQPLPEDHEKRKDDFIRFVENETIDVDLNGLGNMDEVPVPFEITSNKMVEQKGEDDVFILTTGHHRSFFTVVLTVTATGEKLKPLIIFKRKTMPKVKFPEGVVVRVNKKEWFKNDVMKDWSEEVWQKRRNCHSDQTWAGYPYPYPSGAQIAISSSCPYLDTIDRSVLDFDFEKLCSISLSTMNVYSCMLCGKYYQRQGISTRAYIHSLGADHRVFLNLQTLKFYCLPDNYEVCNPSLEDIKYVVKPTYSKALIALLDVQMKMCRAYNDSTYFPGIVGLNNIKSNDYCNVILYLDDFSLDDYVNILKDVYQNDALIKLSGFVGDDGLFDYEFEIEVKLWHNRTRCGEYAERLVKMEDRVDTVCKVGATECIYQLKKILLSL